MKTRNMTKTEKLMMTKVVTQYVYLLQTREFLNSKEPVYKIGRSKQDNYARFSQYGLGSVLLFQSSCHDSVKLEKEIIDLFNDKYERIKILGNEWFRGDADEMKADFCDIIKNSITTRKFRNNDTISILDAFVEVCLQEEMLQYLVEECTQQYLVEECTQQYLVEECTQNENIVEKFIDEIMQDVFVEETLQEIIQDVIVEETISGFVVENEDYGRVLLDDEEVVVEVEEVEDEEVVDEVVEDEVEDEVVEEDEEEGNNNNFREKKFTCMTCEYGTNVKCNLKKHSLTNKHLSQVSPETVVPLIITYNYQCKVCNKGYKSHSGLWKHSQVCKAPEVIVTIAPDVAGSLHTKIDNLERIILEMANKQ